MRITLIGMSGSGKSLWSSVLSRHGFHKLGCDKAIGRRLVDDGELAEGSLDLIGRWMKFPFETGFARREALDLEVLCDPTPDQPLEVDTLIAPVRSFLEQRRSSHGA